MTDSIGIPCPCQSNPRINVLPLPCHHYQLDSSSFSLNVLITLTLFTPDNVPLACIQHFKRVSGSKKENRPQQLPVQFLLHTRHWYGGEVGPSRVMPTQGLSPFGTVCLNKEITYKSRQHREQTGLHFPSPPTHQISQKTSNKSQHNIYLNKNLLTSLRHRLLIDNRT